MKGESVDNRTPTSDNLDNCVVLRKRPHLSELNMHHVCIFEGFRMIHRQILTRFQISGTSLAPLTTPGNDQKNHLFDNSSGVCLLAKHNGPERHTMALSWCHSDGWPAGSGHSGRQSIESISATVRRRHQSSVSPAINRGMAGGPMGVGAGLSGRSFGGGLGLFFWSRPKLE